MLYRLFVVVLLAVTVACGKKTPVVTTPPDPFASYASVISLATKLAKDPNAPLYAPGTGTHCQRTVDVLAATAQREHIAIENWPLVVLNQTFSDPAQPSNVYGVSLHERRRILVAVEVPSCGRAEILAHELAHLIGPQGLDPDEEEVAADLVQYGVNRALGYDTTQSTATYLRLHVNAVPLTPRMRTWVLLTVEQILMH